MNRVPVRRASASVIEHLENRQLLSSASPRAAFTPTTTDLTSIKSGPFAKGGGGLIDIFKEFTKFVKSGGNRSQFNSSLADKYVINGKFIGLTMQTSGTVDALTARVKGLGGSIIYRSRTRHVVEAYVPISQTDNLASDSNLLHLRPMLRPTVASVGEGVNQAERALKSIDVLPAYGVDGTGQTVGVISDSFDSTFTSRYIRSNGSAAVDVATGDLPDVNVLSDVEGGTNEGRAMSQLIHDVAPGADLAFSASGNSQLTFANSITNLRETAHSSVIVDDISFGAEPYFQAGVIERAINDVTDDGASYLSAAGNQGFAGYQRQADFIKDPTVKGGYLVDFDPGKGVSTKLNINIQKPGDLFLQWDDAYDGVVADVKSDVDFYLYRDGALITSSTDNNFATGIPVEAIAVQDPGQYQIMIKVNSVAKGGSLPTLYKFAANGNNNDMFDARTDVDFANSTSTSAVSGHAHASMNIPVGAVDYAFTNALGSSRGVSNEVYSSGGTVLERYDQNGNRYDTPQTVRGVLLSSVDATATTVRGTTLDDEPANFTEFRGTSAAAPNAAAVVALLRQLSPDSDPETIRDALVASAKNNPLNGNTSGKLDSQGGYGLIDAVAAAAILKPTVPIATIDEPTGSNHGSIGSVQITFSEPVTGVDLSDFTLTRDGTMKNRFTGSESLTASSDGKTYTIGNLRSATSVLGSYTVELRNAHTDIVDVDGNAAAGNVLSFDVTLRKPGNLVAHQLDDGKIRLVFADTNTGEDDYRVQRATDAKFSQNLRNIGAGAGATSFTDADVTPGQIYYYRVRAVKGGKFGDVASTSIVASSEGEVFVDNLDVRLKGDWTRHDDYGGSFLGTEARAPGTDVDEVANTAIFSSNSVAAGQYFLYTSYTARDKNATNARYDILQNGKVMTTVTIDETKRGSGWVLLGKFASSGRGALSVRVTSYGANGSVAADAIRFLPADVSTIEAFEKQREADEAASS